MTSSKNRFLDFLNSGLSISDLALVCGTTEKNIKNYRKYHNRFPRALWEVSVEKMGEICSMWMRIYNEKSNEEFIMAFAKKQIDKIVFALGSDDKYDIIVEFICFSYDYHSSNYLNSKGYKQLIFADGIAFVKPDIDIENWDGHVLSKKYKSDFLDKIRSASN